MHAKQRFLKVKSSFYKQFHYRNIKKLFVYANERFFLPQINPDTKNYWQTFECLQIQITNENSP